MWEQPSPLSLKQSEEMTFIEVVWLRRTELGRDFELSFEMVGQLVAPG
jgi:hypothetical protein